MNSMAIPLASDNIQIKDNLQIDMYKSIQSEGDSIEEIKDSTE